MTEPINVLYTIVPDLNLLYYLSLGSLEGRDLLAAERAAAGDPRRRLGMRILVDISLVTSFSYELDDHKGLIALNQALVDRGRSLEKTAFLGRHDFDLTMGDALSLAIEPIAPVEMAVFLHLREAVAWLGLEDDYAAVTAIQRELQRQAVAASSSSHDQGAP